MRVCDAKKFAEKFRDLPGADNEVSLEFSSPWSFDGDLGEGQVDFGKNGGVYLYSNPGTPRNVSMEKNTQPIWYIGKSDSDLANRVWANMGYMYEPETGEECDPPFKYHRWAGQEAFSQDIRSALSKGDVVVYTIKVAPLGETPGYPNSLEKFLLSHYYRLSGALPPLNSDI